LEPRSFKLTVAYDGAEFSGWQWQPGRRTVQGVLEEALQRITGETLRVSASGRTDAGVHALGQVVSFASATYLAADVLQRALNAHLPDDVRVVAAAEAQRGFHAIDDSIGKRYRYLLQEGPVPNVFARRYAWFVRTRLDIEAMRTAASELVGQHDFKSFETTGSPRVSTIRTVRDLTVSRQIGLDGRPLVVVEVEADGFLYNMVRNLVGTLREVGLGRRAAAWAGTVLRQRDRRQAGMTAPPHGLYLLRVFFREDPDDGVSSSAEGASPNAATPAASGDTE
jgi:tRNA pseudouridine38-40 synthase